MAKRPDDGIERVRLRRPRRRPADAAEQRLILDPADSAVVLKADGTILAVRSRLDTPAARRKASRARLLCRIGREPRLLEQLEEAFEQHGNIVGWQLVFHPVNPDAKPGNLN